MEEKSLATREQFGLSIEETSGKIEAMHKFIATVMKTGVDFMELQGKSCLLKSGAEKLENLHGYSHSFESVDKVEDFDKKFFFYRYRCIVKDKTGRAISECIGSSNNREKGRANQDPYSLVNTIDKMAQKRAYVGAIIAACRVSSDFTQDLDDSPEVEQKPERKVVNAFPGVGKPLECKCTDCKKEISTKVEAYSKEHFGEALCMDCQTKRRDSGVAEGEDVDV